MNNLPSMMLYSSGIHCMTNQRVRASDHKQAHPRWMYGGSATSAGCRIWKYVMAASRKWTCAIVSSPRKSTYCDFNSAISAQTAPPVKAKQINSRASLLCIASIHSASLAEPVAPPLTTSMTNCFLGTMRSTLNQY